MEKSQKKGFKSKSLILLSLILATMVMMSGAPSSVNATYAPCYTYFTDVPQWAQPSVAKCLNSGALAGTGSSDGTPVLNISEDLARTIVLLDRLGYFSENSDQVQDSWVPVLTAPFEEDPEELTEDRSKPLYNVYKGDFHVNAPTDIQWMIRDFATQYNFPEEIIFGMITMESTFNPKTAGDSGKSLGLCQIQKYWIKEANITHFTEDYRSRDLFDPHDNLLTLMEIWSYARDSYKLQLYNEDGSINLDDCSRLLRWHSSGKCPSDPCYNFYTNSVIKYSNSLVALQ